MGVPPDDTCVEEFARHLAFEGPANFRDLGGYVTEDGRRTRWRTVFRADGLHRLTSPEDLDLFGSLGIRVVYDLRGDDECERSPDPMTCRRIVLERYVPRSEFEDGSVLREARQAELRLREVYRAILRTAGALFGELLVGLTEPDGLPAVFHCAGGKDRTGLVAALLLGALGCDRATILQDYELTNTCVSEQRRVEVAELFVANGMTPEAAAGLLGAPRSVMADALSMLDEEHGGILGYLDAEAGVGRAVVADLRARLLD